MPARQATSLQERQTIASLAAQGLGHAAIAAATGLSYWTVRKWARRVQRQGLAGLLSEPGRPPGLLTSFDPLVRYVVLRLKRQHPTWGAAYIRKKLSEHPALQGQRLPEASTIWRYWRRFGERLRPRRDPPALQPLPSGVVHGVWQLDFKESVAVAGIGRVTIAHARDEHGRATLLHQVHVADDPQQWCVKLSTAQVQTDCRIAFTRWGLPDAIQTDRATLFVGDEPTPFPTRLSLWWCGLGIEHRLIPLHTPQRNGAVERAHRTLYERTLCGQHFLDAEHLQAQVERDWHELNTQCPSRATTCHGLPPLEAHPDLLQPRRPYAPEWESALFDMQRLYDHLASFTWLRTVSQVGQLSLGGYRYGIGAPFAGQTVRITLDGARRQFRFTLLRPDGPRGRRLPELAPVWRDPCGLSVAEITGLPAALDPLPVRQLMLPWPLCDTSPPNAA